MDVVHVFYRCRQSVMHRQSSISALFSICFTFGFGQAFAMGLQPGCVLRCSSSAPELQIMHSIGVLCLLMLQLQGSKVKLSSIGANGLLLLELHHCM